MNYEDIYSAAYNEATQRYKNRSDVDIDHVSHGYGLRAVANAAFEEAAKICETAPDLLQNSTFDGAAEVIRSLKESLP